MALIDHLFLLKVGESYTADYDSVKAVRAGPDDTDIESKIDWIRREAAKRGCQLVAPKNGIVVTFYREG